MKSYRRVCEECQIISEVYVVNVPGFECVAAFCIQSPENLVREDSEGNRGERIFLLNRSREVKWRPLIFGRELSLVLFTVESPRYVGYSHVKGLVWVKLISKAEVKKSDAVAKALCSCSKVLLFLVQLDRSIDTLR